MIEGYPLNRQNVYAGMHAYYVIEKTPEIENGFGEWISEISEHMEIWGWGEGNKLLKKLLEEESSKADLVDLQELPKPKKHKLFPTDCLPENLGNRLYGGVIYTRPYYGLSGELSISEDAVVLNNNEQITRRRTVFKVELPSLEIRREITFEYGPAKTIPVDEAISYLKGDRPEIQNN